MWDMLCEHCQSISSRTGGYGQLDEEANLKNRKRLQSCKPLGVTTGFSFLDVMLFKFTDMENCENISTWHEISFIKCCYSQVNTRKCTNDSNNSALV